MGGSADNGTEFQGSARARDIVDGQAGPSPASGDATMGTKMRILGNTATRRLVASKSSTAQGSAQSSISLHVDIHLLLLPLLPPSRTQ